MVNVIDNGARNRTNMIPVGIKVIDDKGNVAYTAKTDLGTNYISLESKWFDSSSNNTGGNTGGSTGGNTGGNTYPNQPSVGADYYAGSLADGEITQRYLEWSGTDDPTKSNTITFSDNQGSKFNGNYDGIQLLGHIQKTVVTKGVDGAVTNLPLNYDTNNVVKSGYYTTNIPYPIYINNSSLNMGSIATVPIIGIGENLSGQNIKAPSISLTLNSDMTLTLTHDKGYKNDGTSSASGAEYQFVVDTISTYSVQNLVSQLPSTVNLFSGSAVGNILLAGSTTYYENVQDGLLITLSNLTLSTEQGLGDFQNGVPAGTSNDPQPDELRFDLSSIGLKPIKIPKEALIINNSFDVSDQLSQYIGKTVPYQYQDQATKNWVVSQSRSITSFEGTTVKVLPNTTLSINIIMHVTDNTGNGTSNNTFQIPVIQVNDYKN